MPIAVAGIARACQYDRESDGERSDERELHDAQQADSGDLAGEQLARTDRREQDLHHLDAFLDWATSRPVLQLKS